MMRKSRRAARIARRRERVRETGARRPSRAAASVSHQVCADARAVSGNTGSMLRTTLLVYPSEGADPESMQRAPLLSGLEADIS